MKNIIWFETTQCMVRVFDTEKEELGERLFIVTSRHNKNGEINVRFGTRQQIYNMLSSYKFSIGKEYREQYETFMNGYKKHREWFQI